MSAKERKTRRIGLRVSSPRRQRRNAADTTVTGRLSDRARASRPLILQAGVVGLGTEIATDHVGGLTNTPSRKYSGRCPTRLGESAPERHQSQTVTKTIVKCLSRPFGYVAPAPPRWASALVAEETREASGVLA